MKNLILTFVSAICLMCIANTLTAQSLPPTSGGEDPVASNGDFTTQTIGGWGSEPTGKNPGSVLHANFNDVFATGITIGSGENTLVFTSAQAVTDFLPASGKAAALKGTFIDPIKKDVRNTFASQILALTISVSFDKAIATFGASSTSLGDMVIAEGDLAGESVYAVLAMANKALAGEETKYSISTLNATISGINENYVDGTTDNGFLTVGTTAGALIQTEKF